MAFHAMVLLSLDCGDFEECVFPFLSNRDGSIIYNSQSKFSMIYDFAYFIVYVAAYDLGLFQCI